MDLPRLRITRRAWLATSGALMAGAVVPAAVAEPVTPGVDPGVRLLPLPTRLYKLRDSGQERTESWTLWLLVQTDAPRPLLVQQVDLHLFSGQQRVRSSHLRGPGVQAITIKPPFSPRRMDGSPAATPIHWPQAVRIRCTEAAGAAIDAMQIDMQLAEGESRTGASARFPVEVYEQKTTLVFPFRGRGVVTQAGVTNGGHRNRSGQFALDVVGLDANYASLRDGADRRPTDYVGWGRPLIAPADGTVVRAVAERPDQPDPDKSNPALFAPEYPNGGDPGNHVVIDHGNGEFSVVAHLQQHSLGVKLGQRVRQGQQLGALGSSGDTVTPHMHYQLQSGPDLQWSDGLPCRFANLDRPLFRGEFFDVR